MRGASTSQETKAAGVLSEGRWRKLQPKICMGRATAKEELQAWETALARTPAQFPPSFERLEANGCLAIIT